jgi:hypothetical protein
VKSGSEFTGLRAVKSPSGTHKFSFQALFAFEWILDQEMCTAVHQGIEEGGNYKTKLLRDGK